MVQARLIVLQAREVGSGSQGQVESPTSPILLAMGSKIGDVAMRLSSEALLEEGSVGILVKITCDL